MRDFIDALCELEIHWRVNCRRAWCFVVGHRWLRFYGPFAPPGGLLACRDCGKEKTHA